MDGGDSYDQTHFLTVQLFKVGMVTGGTCPNNRAATRAPTQKATQENTPLHMQLQEDSQRRREKEEEGDVEMQALIYNRSNKVRRQQIRVKGQSDNSRNETRPLCVYIWV